MEKETFTIVNENEHDVVGEILRNKKAGKLPCIIFSHGLLENRKAPYIKTLTKKFLDAGWAVVNHDYSQGFGESGGRSEDVTISQQAKDLERVVAYTKRRSFINLNKVVVFGHCYGAMTALAMEGFQHVLAALILVSTPARIEETALTRKGNHEMMKVRLKRYFHIHHGDKEVRINYSFYEDGLKIDMDRAARNLTTPCLFVHGVKDESIPADNTQRMFDRAVGQKELLLLDKMGHDIKGAAITAIYDAAKKFLKKQKIA